MRRSAFSSHSAPQNVTRLHASKMSKGQKLHDFAASVKHCAERLAGLRTHESFNCTTASSLPDIRSLAGWNNAISRLERAREDGERIVIYGDYDCDGICSVVLFLDFFGAAGLKMDNVRAFIPNRRKHGYGLSKEGIRECLSVDKPSLMLVVDCGSNSFQELLELSDGHYDARIEAVVVDHHLPKVGAGEADSHPSFAHLNPKFEATPLAPATGLTEMCAAGLVFLICERLAKDWEVPSWERNRAVVLAGLATYADVVPLVRANRDLVKSAIAECRNSSAIPVPGLQAMHLKLYQGMEKLPPVDESTFGYNWGPCINAPGRLKDATPAVELLRAKDAATAEPFAKVCCELNNRRIAITDRILEEADRQAIAQVHDHNPANVILAAGEKWDPGVVGIVASRLKDKYRRPVIVAGKYGNGDWRASGRSVPGFDLGAAVLEAASKDFIKRGGGHPKAAGLSFSEEQRPELHRWLMGNCPLKEIDFAPRTDVLVLAHELPVKSWKSVMDALGPLGEGNPYRSIILQDVLISTFFVRIQSDCRHGQKPLAEARFKHPDRHGDYILVLWLDVKRAAREWRKDRRYTLELTTPRHWRSGAWPFFVLNCWRA